MSKKNDDLGSITSPLIPLDWYLATGDKGFLKLAAVAFVVDLVLTLSEDGPKPYNKDGSSNDDPSDFVTFLIFDLPLALMMSFASFIMQPGALGPDSAQPFSGMTETSGSGTGTPDSGMGTSEAVLPTEGMISEGQVASIETMIGGDNGTLAPDEMMSGETANQIMSGEMDFEMENQGLLNAGENALSVDNIADIISSASDTKTVLNNINDLINKAQSGLESNEQMNKIDELLDDYMDESGTEDNNADLFGSE